MEKVIFGACNKFDSIYPFKISPHDIGYLATHIILKWINNNNRFSNLRVFNSIGLINQALISNNLKCIDLVILDDIYLSIGKFKFVDYSSYSRGHNMIKWHEKFIGRKPIVKEILLIGAKQDKVISQDFVTTNYQEPDLIMVSIAIICISRAVLIGWGNNSHIIKLAKDLFKYWDNRNGR